MERPSHPDAEIQGLLLLDTGMWQSILLSLLLTRSDTEKDTLGQRGPASPKYIHDAPSAQLPEPGRRGHWET